MTDFGRFDSYKWFGDSAKDNDVVVSTRVRLARNLKDYPFSPRLGEVGAREIIEKVRTSPAMKNFEYTDFAEVSRETAAALAERHIVSAEFAASAEPHGLLAKPSDGLYVMLCEEDHVRLQCLKPGLSLDEAYKTASDTESALDDSIGFAYSERFGYLTHCPTNLGTGMRASVMMFLPAISAAGGIRSLQSQLAKIGLTVRGMSGEGSTADGHLYQISNQITLGVSEEETLKRLATVVENIVKRERELRGNVGEGEIVRLRDRVRRAMGIMKYAELMETKELFDIYEKVRLGAAMDMTDGITCEMMDGLLFTSMPAGITAESGDVLKTPMDRDAVRAAKARAVAGAV